MNVPGQGEVPVRIPSVLVIPGNVGYLKQHFSAMLFVANGAPGGSGLVVREVAGTIRLPAGSDRVVGTADDPLSLPDTVDGPQPETRPVRSVGIDGQPGTADDVGALSPGEQGQTEFVLRGEEEGFHEVAFDIAAVLDGLVTGPVEVTGTATGGVLVRNPYFDLSFTVPSVVRDGEPFSVFVTVTNISQSLANDVSLTLDASRLSGARQSGPLTQSVDTLRPQDSALLEFELLAERTGQVVADYLRFDTSSGTTGDLRFTLAVGDRGVPLSPDTLVLPTAVDRLPSTVVAAAMRVLGQGWSLANAPSAVLPEGVIRTGREIVTQKALALAEAGLRVELGQSTEGAVRDVVVDFHGEPTDVGFDQLLRESEAGRDFDVAVGAALQAAVAGAGGPLGYEEDLASLAASGPARLSFAVDGAPVRVRLVDGQGHESSGGLDSGAFEVGQVARAALLPVGSGARAQVGLLAEPEAFPYTVELEGLEAGTVDLSVSVPRTSGSSGAGMLRGSLRSVPVTAGGRYRVRVGRSPSGLDLERDAGGDGVFEGVTPLGLQTLTPAGPRFLSATVLGPETLDGAGPFGFHLALLFDRVVDEASAAELGNYLISDNRVVAARRQLSGRLVFASLEQPEGPYVPTLVTAGGVRDLAGAERLPVTVDLGSRLEDPGAVVSGTVREADGTPVAGASVVYAQNPNLRCVPPLGGLRGLTAVTTGSDGRYRLRYVRQDACGLPFRLSSRDPASGAVREVSSSVRTAGEQITLDLTRIGKGAVEGTVRDLSGNPVAGAQVTVVSETDPQLSGSGRSAIDGRYRVEGVAVGTVRVTAVLDASLGRAAGRLDRSGSTAVVDVTLDGGTVEVSGRVLKVENGTVTPVPSLEVIFRAEDAGKLVPVATTVTSGTGEYRFDGMPTGPFRVDAALNTRDRGSVAGVAGAGERLTGQDVLIEVAAGATVRGRVLLPDGSPAAGAVVAIDGRGVLSELDGTFAIPGVAILPEQPQTVEARSADGRRMGTASVVVGAPLVDGVVIALSGLGSAELTVLDPNGQPLVGQQVVLLGDCYNPCGCAEADTGSDGRVRFDDLPLGSASFRATRVGPGFVDQVGTTLPLSREGATVTGVLRFAGVGTVSGMVLGPDGEPALGADVALTSKVFDSGSCRLQPGVSHRVRTDEAGGFRFTGVNLGPVSVTATHSFFPTAVGAKGTLLAAGDEVSFELQLVDSIAGELSGTVFLPDGTTPAGAGVEVTADGPLPDVTVETDAAGGFRFAKILPEGTYTVTAQDPVTGGAVQERLFLQSGQDSVHDLRLKGKGTVRVRVQDVGGDPVESAFVRLEEGEYPRRRFEAALDASSLGTATFDGVFEGPVSVEVSDAFGRGGRASTVLPRPGDTVEVVVSLTVTGTVRGRFLRPDGVTPIPFAAVTLSASGRVVGQATTAGTGDVGAFRFDYVPAGPVRIEAEDPLTGRSGLTVGAIEREDQELVLDVVAQGLGTVTGLVTHNGAPQAGADVEIASGSYRVSSVAGSDGRYRVEGVPEGSVVVTADLGGGFLSGSRSAVLAGDGTVLTLDVALRASGEVTGRVLAYDGVTPAPLSVVTVQVGGVGGGTLSATTEVDGSFRFPQVPAGAATLTADVVGGVDRGRVTAEVPEGGTVDVPIVLVGTGGIDGQALDSDGAPVAGEVTLRGTGSFPYTLGLTTGPDGRFFVPELLAGPVTASLRVSAGGFALHGMASGAIVPGETTPLVVQVEPSGTVTGLVVRSDGATPAVGAEVTVRLDGGRGSIGLQVEPDGRFVAEGVPLGRFDVAVSDPVTAGVALARGLELTANGETVDLGTVVLDDTPVEVVSVAPEDGAVGVPVDTPVMVTFSDPLASPAGVAVLHGGAALPLEATLSADGLEVTLTGTLPDTAELTVVAGAGVSDVFGRSLAETFTSHFRTLDLAPPAVVATVPQDGALEVDPATAIAVTFDEALDPATDLGALIGVSGPAGAVAGSAAFDSPTAVVFTPAAPLAADGLYVVTVVGAVDVGGNVQEEPVVFAFATPDTVPPVLAIEEPAPDGWVPTARPTLRIAVDDALSGVAPATATLSLDGEALAPAFEGGEAGELSATPEADLGEGVHQVAATVADQVGNVGSLEAGFGVDTVPPDAAAIEGIAAGQVLSGAVVVGATAEDATSGVAELRVFVDGALAATLETPFEPVPVDTTSLADGLHSLAAHAVDRAGNLGPVGEPVLVVVDNRPLVVEITAPAAGAAFRVSVVVQASVSEPVDHVEFQAGAGAVVADAEAPFEAELDLSAVAEGPALLTATAVGLGGETATATVEVVVDRTPPPPPDASRITAEDVQGGLSHLTGTAGAVEGEAAVEATNTTTGASATGRAGPDGAFFLQIEGAAGDVVSLVAVDAAGNRSGATELTVRNAGEIGGVPVDGLQMWVRADAGVVTDANGTVERWIDQSDAGNDLVQSAEGERPVPAVDPATGDPVLRFDGVDDVLRFPSRLESIRTVFWVLRESPSAPNEYRTLLGDSYYSDFHGGYRELWHAGSSSGFVRNGETYVDGTLVDGTQTERPETLSVISLVTTGAVRADNFARDRTLSSRTWWGDLAELIVYDRPLSDAERSGVEEYLRSKYLPEVSQVAPPLITPNGGTFSGTATVRLATTAPGARIRYTTDGEAPDATSALYEGPFDLTETTTVKAVVFRGGVPISSAAVARLVREDELPLSREGLSLWLRADAGVVLDVQDHVIRWADQSGRGNDAGLSDPDEAPVRVPEAAQGQPVLRFDGADDVLRFPSRLESIRTVFWVLRESPSAPNEYRTLLGDSYYSDFHGGYRELWHAGSSSGFVRNGETYVDGTLVDGTQTERPETLSVISLVTTGAVRADNFARDRTLSSRTWWGDLAELIVYDRSLGDEERRRVEGYLRLKYLPAVERVAPPLIEPNGGTFSGSVTVTLSAPLAGAEIRYTTDGTAPDSTSALYGGPFVVTETTTVKAVIFRGGVPISSAAVARLVREDELPLSRDGLSLWLRADAGVALDAEGHVRRWADQSGLGNDAVLVDPDEAPVRLPEAARGWPVLRFDGADDVLRFTSRLESIRTVFWVLRESPSAPNEYRTLFGRFVLLGLPWRVPGAVARGLVERIRPQRRDLRRRHAGGRDTDRAAGDVVGDLAGDDGRRAGGQLRPRPDAVEPHLVGRRGRADRLRPAPRRRGTAAGGGVSAAQVPAGGRAGGAAVDRAERGDVQRLGGGDPVGAAGRGRDPLHDGRDGPGRDVAAIHGFVRGDGDDHGQGDGVPKRGADLERGGSQAGARGRAAAVERRPVALAPRGRRAGPRCRGSRSPVGGPVGPGQRRGTCRPGRGAGAGSGSGPRAGGATVRRGGRRAALRVAPGVDPNGLLGVAGVAGGSQRVPDPAGGLVLRGLPGRLPGAVARERVERLHPRRRDLRRRQAGGRDADRAAGDPLGDFAGDDRSRAGGRLRPRPDAVEPQLVGGPGGADRLRSAARRRRAAGGGVLSHLEVSAAAGGTADDRSERRHLRRLDNGDALRQRPRRRRRGDSLHHRRHRAHGDVSRLHRDLPDHRDHRGPGCRLQRRRPGRSAVVDGDGDPDRGRRSDPRRRRRPGPLAAGGRGVDGRPGEPGGGVARPVGEGQPLGSPVALSGPRAGAGGGPRSARRPLRRQGRHGSLHDPHERRPHRLLGGPRQLFRARRTPAARQGCGGRRGADRLLRRSLHALGSAAHEPGDPGRRDVRRRRPGRRVVDAASPRDVHSVAGHHGRRDGRELLQRPRPERPVLDGGAGGAHRLRADVDGSRTELRRAVPEGAVRAFVAVNG